MSSGRKKKSEFGNAILLCFSIILIIIIFGVAFGIDTDNPATIVVAIVLTFLILLGNMILRLPVVKGAIGEYKVAKVLKKIAKRKNGFVINDVIIPDVESNKTSQIDHILFTTDGIAVVETKNYIGRIYGSDYQKDWVQVLNYGHKKNKIYSPLMQNDTHLYRLSKLLNLTKHELIGYVVFVRSNITYIDSDNVYTLKMLTKSLRRMNTNIFTQSDIESFYNKIKFYKDNPIQTKKEHIEEIKQMKSDIENNICPRCGGNLVLRKSKDGNTFWGCSNYPNCKFTKKN